ncbi:unnamed protein product [Blepharisma stoltei]|uniref:ATP synthase F0 subunit 8 n=1 Tax=Blepharisma stoltei TaxID=1481888 RepID=A0AAU9JYX4_9CILI|nr:unnamed protein product [Blepharisma stoltei]
MLQNGIGEEVNETILIFDFLLFAGKRYSWYMLLLLFCYYILCFIISNRMTKTKHQMKLSRIFIYLQAFPR